MENSKLCPKFNREGNILVISSYPPQGSTYGDNVVGIASFTKNSLSVLTDRAKIKAVVLAEIFSEPAIYREGNILVWRCWKRGSPAIYFQILRSLLIFNKIRTLEVQLEFNNFGNIFVTALLPVFSLLTRLMGKRTVLVLHQVITNLSELSGHLGTRPGDIKTRFLTRFIKLYYFICGLTYTRLAVLETELANRLADLGVAAKKITVLEHGVDTGRPLGRQSLAKHRLHLSDKQVILVFGFLTWYKGTDLIIKAYKRFLATRPALRRKIHLVVAGGPNPNHLNEAHYRKFVDNLYQLSKNHSGISITGFVKEADIPKYFCAADAVVLPYRTFMSSSGPLSLALSFGKPFLLSSALSGLSKSSNLDLPQEIFFEPTKEGIAKALKWLTNGNFPKQKLSELSLKLRTKRSFENNWSDHYAILFPDENTVPALQLPLKRLPWDRLPTPNEAVS